MLVPGRAGGLAHHVEVLGANLRLKISHGAFNADRRETHAEDDLRPLPGPDRQIRVIQIAPDVFAFGFTRAGGQGLALDLQTVAAERLGRFNDEIDRLVLAQPPLCR